MSAIKSEATIEDLYRVPENGKAEIVNGELVIMSPTGCLPSRANSNIYLKLREREKFYKDGYAFNDNAGFIVNLPNRRSFSPDAAYFIGNLTGMKFLEGAPTFAVEVRSEGDYGVSAEKEIAQKRADYFAAGTRVVWDVDLLSEDVVEKYVWDRPDEPQIFRRGEMADAEPALPSWRMAVDEIFE